MEGKKPQVAGSGLGCGNFGFRGQPQPNGVANERSLTTASKILGVVLDFYRPSPKERSVALGIFLMRRLSTHHRTMTRNRTNCLKTALVAHPVMRLWNRWVPGSALDGVQLNTARNLSPVPGRHKAPYEPRGGRLPPN